MYIRMHAYEWNDEDECTTATHAHASINIFIYNIASNLYVLVHKFN